MSSGSGPTQDRPAGEVTNQEMRVLIFSGARGDTRRYRCFHLHEQFLLAGIDSRIAHLTDLDLAARIAQSTVAIIHRGAYDSFMERLFHIMHRNGCLAIYDIDDFIYDPQAFDWINSLELKGSLRAELYQKDMRRYGTTLKKCHAVMVSTDYLAHQVRTLGKSVWVHRNAFSLEMLEISERANRQVRPSDGKVIIGYASGTPTHDQDFAVAKPALKYILQRYPQVELSLIGPLDPGRDWGSLQDRVKQTSLVPWRELPQRLAQFDINIAPLVVNNPFGQSKSEIKFVEAGLVKVPTVASLTDAYQSAIRPGENGYLAATDQEWIDRLVPLVEDGSLRREIGKVAYQDVLERYHPKSRAADLIRSLDRMYVETFGRPLWNRQTIPDPYAHPRPLNPSWLVPSIERKPTHLLMAYYYLKYRNFPTFLALIWIYIRRLLAPIFPYKKPTN